MGDHRRSGATFWSRRTKAFVPRARPFTIRITVCVSFDPVEKLSDTTDGTVSHVDEAAGLLRVEAFDLFGERRLSAEKARVRKRRRDTRGAEGPLPMRGKIT